MSCALPTSSLLVELVKPSNDLGEVGVLEQQPVRLRLARVISEHPLQRVHISPLRILACFPVHDGAT